MVMTQKEIVEKKFKELEPRIDSYLEKGNGGKVSISFYRDDLGDDYDLFKKLPNTPLFDLVKEEYGLQGWNVEIVPEGFFTPEKIIFTPNKK